jgi:maleate isomerase
VFGHRARIGYTAPLISVEVFPFEFYRMVPEGVTLILTTAGRLASERAGAQTNPDLARAAAKEMAEAGASIVVLGGASPGLAMGAGVLDDFAHSLEDECGVLVTTAFAAQQHALKQVGARRVGVITPFGDTDGGRLEQFGYQVVGTKGAGCTYSDFGRVPTDTPAQVARQLFAEHPEADTLFFPAAHWPAASNAEALEQELGINVVTSTQAIVWHALRRCGIADRLAGYGRLLRDF